MSKKFGGRIGTFALSAVLCMPLALGVLSGCGGKGSMKQSTEKDSEAVTFTALDEVTITDPYAVNALAKELDYLLLLDADRLLADFRNNAGLDTKGKSAYTTELPHGDRWEGALIGGHILGHYLSALGQAYLNAGTPAEKRTKILEKSNYIVAALKECQDQATARGAKEGFLWGAEVINRNNLEIQFDNVEKGYTNIGTQAWVPWYTMHKILQGLIDAYNLTGNATAKDVASKLGDWTYNRASRWSEATQAKVLGIEYGGMNDCLYNLYAITGKDEHAIAAHKFDETNLFAQILNEGKDYLNNKHANTTIPKIIGALNRYVVLDGKTVDGKVVDAGEMLEVAEKFWDKVVYDHSYVTGGNSEWEHFGQDNVLNAERTNANCETCNTYNMLKLSRMLFAITGDRNYLDFYENTYYNAIWSSQNPETGMTTYFQPMASGYFKVYSTAENSFWCCTGSGMESFSKLGDSIYYDAGNATYVSLYLDSTYKKDGLEIKQTADLESSDTVTLEVLEGSTVLRLRRPAWSPVFEVQVGKKTVEVGEKDKFVSVDVKKGDTVTVNMKKTVTAHDIVDGENVYAFKYGPFVLSAELGTEDMQTTTTGVNVTIPKDAVRVHTLEIKADAAGGKVDSFMEKINDYMTRGADGRFTLAGVSHSYTFSYHFRQYQERYAIYLQFGDNGTVEEVVDPWEWKNSDTVQPGYGQYETDSLHAMTESSEGGSVGVTDDGTYRYATAGNSFTYRMAVVKGAQNRLVLYFRGADKGKTILVKSGSTTLYSATLSSSVNSYQVIVPVPDAVVAAAETIEANNTRYDVIPITFSGVNGAESAKVCSYIYMQALTFVADATRNSKLAYFVNCGDYDVYTLNAGDKLGMYNSVTDQVYGADIITGKKWGIVDTYPSTGGGAAPSGVWTNSTWAQEGLTSEADKTVSNRYTKNQTESSLARKLAYKFDLEDGAYKVKMYFTDPWGVSKNPNVSANGERKLSSAAIGQEVSFTVTVSGGELLLEITSDSACINLAYIIIEFA